MELDDAWTVLVPRTAAKWREERTGEIAETLLDELTAQAPELLGDICAYSGGWSADEEVEILKMQFHEQQLDVKVRIRFVEMRPSGCSDSPRRDDRVVEYALTMHREDDCAFVNHSPSNPDQGDTLDRNSAADGT